LSLFAIDVLIRYISSSPSFFFKAEDGIRDFHVTGVQTCALPIFFSASERAAQQRGEDPAALHSEEGLDAEALAQSAPIEVGSGRSASSAGTAAPQREETATRALESHQGRTADAPLRMTCGTKMRPAGTCYVCEGCGSTSGCS